jgi:hypothetical protein
MFSTLSINFYFISKQYLFHPNINNLNNTNKRGIETLSPINLRAYNNSQIFKDLT